MHHNYSLMLHVLSCVEEVRMEVANEITGLEIDTGKWLLEDKIVYLKFDKIINHSLNLIWNENAYSLSKLLILMYLQLSFLTDHARKLFKYTPIRVETIKISNQSHDQKCYSFSYLKNVQEKLDGKHRLQWPCLP